MAAKEAQARIKINKLLEEAGWRLLDGVGGKANVMLEANVKLDALGDNFEAMSNGFVDFLLLDERGHPVVVLEAKSEDKNPLAGKEQARKYARGHCCDFVILSNGNLHYLWDLRQGNPELIVRFPSPASISEHRKFEPSPNRLTDEVVGNDYIVRTQYPDYESDASYRNLAERDAFILKHGLRFLRDYQKRAVHKLQDAVAERNHMAHANGNVFCRTQAAAQGKIENILARLHDVQTKIAPLLQRCFERFLADNAHAEQWEYAAAEDQVRGGFIQPYYLSPQDVAACLQQPVPQLANVGAAHQLHSALHACLPDSDHFASTL